MNNDGLMKRIFRYRLKGSIASSLYAYAVLICSIPIRNGNKIKKTTKVDALKTVLSVDKSGQVMINILIEGSNGASSFMDGR